MGFGTWDGLLSIALVNTELEFTGLLPVDDLSR